MSYNIFIPQINFFAPVITVSKQIWEMSGTSFSEMSAVSWLCDLVSVRNIIQTVVCAKKHPELESLRAYLFASTGQIIAYFRKYLFPNVAHRQQKMYAEVFFIINLNSSLSRSEWCSRITSIELQFVTRTTNRPSLYRTVSHFLFCCTPW